ncbi:MAG: alpha/beta fold hydrolase [Hydrogenophaga sp.]|uniref:alpha/beta fold hydrolase n=1 Tax=Hydrogenophaga sp. TaxID=1904254 RepID=UPI0016A21332|nr:alpha/beta fold hydrolase [Hydrogenophaga sp.]NIM40836.1 alpha/beta fold hydrolase [Hydrogenophaga sp.]NIN26311.1 alpha/beta fold hydrolase [Hydrogenophaga sp.]NIN31176.1 alpha/beta fold hydrolase [Hydrogenophaga sp.]NIN55219.1 alpha/beta fold hydrolase [Hydrogenophaga sp.]NIO51262.1 alpha/beta fold hydrolase [Hydrogenophaga sp.]
MSHHAAEQTLLLGQSKGLVGVITPPLPPANGQAPREDAPFVVILNAGIIHRVGPNRLHVSLARTLSADGFPVLRVDLSGLGDSAAREDGLAPLDATLADIREIIDTLEATRQVKRVVLMGLCSGADHSVIYASTDPRVVGVALLDPSIPRTTGYYVKHYSGRLLSLRTWKNVAMGRHPLWQLLKKRRAQELPVLGEGGGPADMASARPAVTLEHPEVRAFLENAYGRALGNGAQFLAVLTSDRERQHNYRGQLEDAFPSLDFKGKLLIEYFDRCDHTFTTLASQQRLVGLVRRWMGGTGFR